MKALRTWGDPQEALGAAKARELQVPSQGTRDRAGAGRGVPTETGTR